MIKKRNSECLKINQFLVNRLDKNYNKNISSLNKLFDNLRPVNFLLRFWLELFDKLIGLFLTPFESHRHEKLFQLL